MDDAIEAQITPIVAPVPNDVPVRNETILLRRKMIKSMILGVSSPEE